MLLLAGACRWAVVLLFDEPTERFTEEGKGQALVGAAITETHFFQKVHCTPSQILTLCGDE